MILPLETTESLASIPLPPGRRHFIAEYRDAGLIRRFDVECVVHFHSRRMTECHRGRGVDRRERLDVENERIAKRALAERIDNERNDGYWSSWRACRYWNGVEDAIRSHSAGSSTQSNPRAALRPWSGSQLIAPSPPIVR